MCEVCAVSTKASYPTDTTRHRLLSTQPPTQSLSQPISLTKQLTKCAPISLTEQLAKCAPISLTEKLPKCAPISLAEQLTKCAPNFDATVPTAAGNILSLMAPLARWAAPQFCWNDMSELPHCCVGSSVVSIHTYLHTCILYVRGLCHLHLRLGPYRHHTSQTSFYSNSARHMQEL